MLNIRKKPFFLSIFLVFCFLIFFIPSFICFFGKTIFHIYAKTAFDSSFKYESLKVEKGRIYLKNISVINDDYYISIDNTKIKLRFSLKDFNIKSAISLQHPVILLKKSLGNLRSFNKDTLNKKRFLKTKFNVKDGKISLNNIENFSFSINQEDYNFPYYLHIGSENYTDSELVVEVSKERRGITSCAEFKGVDCREISSSLSFFSDAWADKINEVKGQLNGDFLCVLSKNKKPKVSANIEFTDFQVKENFSNKIFAAKSATVNLNSFKKKKSSYLAKKICENFKVRMSVKGGSVSSGDEANPLFENLALDLFYNPELGPRIDLSTDFYYKDEASELSKVQKYPLQLTTRGYFDSDFCNWLDFDISIPSIEGEEKIALKLLEKQSDKCELHASISNLGPKLIGVITPFLEANSNLNNMVLSKGKISSEIEGSFTDSDKPILSIKQFSAEDIHISRPESFEVVANSIKGMVDIDFKKDILNTLTASIALSGADISYKLPSGDALEVNNMKGTLTSRDGLISPSSISYEMKDLKTNIKFSGKISELIANAEIKGSSRNILKHDIDDRMSCILTFKRKNLGGYFSGIMQVYDYDNTISTQENIVFGVTFNEFIFSDINSSISSLWFRGENIILDKFQSIIPLKDTKVKGRVNLNAFLQKDKFSVQCQAKDFEYDNKYYRVSLDQIGSYDDNFFESKDNIVVSYDLTNKKVDIKFPEISGDYYLKKYDLNFVCKKTSININEKLVTFNLPDVISENINMSGHVYLDFSLNDSPKLDILTDSINGDIENLKGVLKHFDLNLSKIDKLSGVFEGKGSSFYFSRFLDKKKPEVVIGTSLGFSDINYEVSEDLNIKNSSFHLDWDSKKDILDLSSLHGDIYIYGKPYKVECPLFIKRGKELSYDLRLGNLSLDIARVKGEVLFTGSEIDIVINRDISHFFGFSCDVKSFVFDTNWKLKKLDVKAGTNISESLLFLDFMPQKYLTFLSRINAAITARCYLDENGKINFNSLSDKLSVDGVDFGKFELDASIAKKQILINLLNIGDVSTTCSLDLDESQLNIKDLKLKKESSKIEGEGIYYLNDSKCDLNLTSVKIDSSLHQGFFEELKENIKLDIAGSIEGKGYVSAVFSDDFIFETDLDLSLAKVSVNSVYLENNNPLNLYYSNKKGGKISGLGFSFLSNDVDLSLLKIDFNYINYSLNEQKLFFEGGQVYIPKFLVEYAKKICPDNLYNLFGYALDVFKFDKDLDFALDIKYCIPEKELSTYSRDANFYINGDIRKFQNLVFYKDKSETYLEFEYLFSDKYHFVRNRFESYGGIGGELIIGKEKEPLSVSWVANSKEVHINRIQGEYLGLSANFTQLEGQVKSDNYSLSGDLKIDFSKVINLFPSHIKKQLQPFNFNKGYELKGNLTLDKIMPEFLGFDGVIVGKDFGIGEYSIKTMFADITLDPSYIKVTDLKVSDIAGVFEVDKLELKKEEGGWLFSVPSIDIKQCRPSLLNKMQNENSEIKPLLIKELKLEDFKGNLSDLSSISGKGNFSFLNSFKRGHSIVEVPADVLSRIFGLDLELLIPVIGDVFFEIKDQKVLFNRIDDVYSENKRSKFFVEDIPYMDFNGDLNINIKMKQYVLFKITDKFILSIKGNVKKPDFTLRKRKLFQNNS